MHSSIPLAFIFEFLAEALIELIIGPILELAFVGIYEVLRWALTRLGVGTMWLARLPGVAKALVLMASLGLGWWWGSYVASTDQTAPPLAMWSLLAMAIVAAGMSGWSPSLSHDWFPDNPRIREFFQFDRARWINFALLNLSGAVGVAAGYFLG